MNTSLKINESLVNKIKKIYQKEQLDNPMPYAVFFAKVGKATVTIFKSKKSQYSLTVAGGNTSDIAKVMKKIGVTQYELISEDGNSSKPTSKVSSTFTYLNDQIGSDEVGTGDFFGPITVVATLVRKKDIARIKELGVMDSKKLDDEAIIKIAKKALNKFPYSSLTLDNKKYNELTKRGFNMNKIKCYLHNQALLNLHHKYPNIKNIYVDQFENRKAYYKHLEDEKEVLQGIFFHTKGESYFPSVALASVLARYSFINKMDALSKKYHMVIPYGASSKVDEFARAFINKYGKKELDKIVKINFKNYQKL